MSGEASFNEDQFLVNEVEEGADVENISGSSDVLSENHEERGERKGRESPYSSSPSLGNEMNISSPLLLQLSEDMSESVVDNAQHVNASEQRPAPITISAPPANQFFPSQVEQMQQEQNFVTFDQADGNGMNFAFQNQSIMEPNTFHPDNSFQMDSQMMNNQDITLSVHNRAKNRFRYIPTPNWRPELHNSTARGVQLPPPNHLSDQQLRAQFGVNNQNNGTNFVNGTTNWANMHANTFGSQDIQFQQDHGLRMDGQGSFYLGGSTPNEVRFPNMPYNSDGNRGGNFVNNNRLGAGQSSSMTRMNMQNGMTLAPDRRQGGFYDRHGSYISNLQHLRRLTRNSVYDPIYEAMGLPLDPHLRIFLSQRGHDGLENPAENPNNGGRNV